MFLNLAPGRMTFGRAKQSLLTFLSLMYLMAA